MRKKKDWEWSAGVAGSGQAGWSNINSLLSQITNGINNLRTNPKDPRQQNILNAALQNIQSHINSGAYILSNSDLGSFIRAEGDNDAAFGAELLSIAVLKKNVGVGKGKFTALAVCALSDFNRGVSKKGAQSTRKALAKLFADYETKISELSVNSNRLVKTLDAAIEKREAKVTQSTSNLARVFGKHKSNLRNEQQTLRTQTKDATDGLLETVKTELADFKDFYESQIALQEPVAYWKSKRVGHRIGSGVFAGLFLIYTGICTFQLYNFATSFTDGFTGFLDFWKDASLSSFGAFASLIALGLVFARLLYRLFASQLHLWNDASERVTMIQTYLALAQKGHAKEEFLGALLARLFSPSSDGVIKDDFGSVGPMDFVMKNLGK